MLSRLLWVLRRLPWFVQGVGVVASASLHTAVEKTTVFKSGTEGYHTFRIPAILRAANGDLLAFAEGRKHHGGDTGDIDLVMKRSRDHGKTWGALQIVWDESANTAGNPCPVIDESSGTIWMLATHNLGTEKEEQITSGTSAGSRTVWVLSSKDHGASWSKPAEITASTKDPSWTWYATGPGIGIQIKHGPHKGRLVIPCDHKYPTSASAKPELGSHAIYSDDHGATWKLGAAIRSGMNECQVVELLDGKGTLLMDMRSYRGKSQRAQSVSRDGGATWSEAVDVPALVDPVCQASIVRWEKAGASEAGVLAFSNPADPKTRIHLTVRASRDNGATWAHALELHAGPSGYSSLVPVSRDLLGCLYESGVQRRYEEIVFARIPAEELLSR